MKQKKKRVAVIVIVLVSIITVHLTYSNIGLKGNKIPIRTPLILVKPLLGEPDSEENVSETGKTHYTYSNYDIWGETGSVRYSGWLWVEEIHASFYPSGDPALKYSEILTELQRVYSEEYSSSTEMIGVQESHSMKRGTTIFIAQLYDSGMISLQLYVY